MLDEHHPQHFSDNWLEKSEYYLIIFDRVEIEANLKKSLIFFEVVVHLQK